MEVLILLALTMWGTTRYGANGALAHARKTEPLRIAERRQRAAQDHERAMARMARRNTRSTPTIAEALSLRLADRLSNPHGGPAREAMALWWADSWGYATERRRVRHERAANGQLGRQKAARAVSSWVAAQWRHRTAQGAPTTAQNGRREPSGGRAQAQDTPIWADADIVDAEVVDETSTSTSSEAQPRQNPAATAAARNGHNQEENADDDRRSSNNDSDPQTETRAAEQDQAEHPEPTDDQLASVHPIRKDTSTMNTHTVTSAEILDPAAGLAFVSSVREAAEQLVSRIELSIASLSERGVSGEPIALLAQMQEAFASAVTASAAAATHFERHVGVQDQVLSDPTLAGTVSGTYVGTRS